MKYRYFYNATGTIVGWCSYKRVCYAVGVSSSVGYVDSNTKHDTKTISVNVDTKTLIFNDN
jgi:hypothetical protein